MPGCARVRRRYLSWFNRYGLRASVFAGFGWALAMFVAIVDDDRALAAVSCVAAAVSFYSALMLHDDPPDPDDPETDFF